MDLTVLNLAVPRISAELQPTSTQLLWILDIYGFLVAGLLITMGSLGHRIGAGCYLAAPRPLAPAFRRRLYKHVQSGFSQKRADRVNAWAAVAPDGCEKA